MPLTRRVPRNAIENSSGKLKAASLHPCITLAKVGCSTSRAIILATHRLFHSFFSIPSLLHFDEAANSLDTTLKCNDGEREATIADMGRL
jgi:hypothetical protein